MAQLLSHLDHRQTPHFAFSPIPLTPITCVQSNKYGVCLAERNWNCCLAVLVVAPLGQHAGRDCARVVEPERECSHSSQRRGYGSLAESFNVQATQSARGLI